MESHTRHTLLAIDDDDLVLGSIQHFFEDYGFTVLTATDGRSGLDMFRLHDPDLVLLDLRMHTMDGLSVLSRIRSTDAHVPVVVASGTHDISDVVKALHLGASDYILKPIRDMDVLLHSVQKCLKQMHLKRENLAYQERLEELVRERTEALDQSHRRYKAIFEHIGIAAIMVEQDGTISQANPGFAQLMGMPRQEIENKRKWCEFVDPRDVETIRSFMFNNHGISPSNQGPVQHEIRLLNDNGANKYVYATLGRIPGAPDQQIISLLDITERKLAETRWKNLERQLRKSQKMEAIGTLAGGIAHDLNNILSPVLGYADMIMRSTEAGGDNFRRSEKIQMAALRAADLVKQILSFNRGGVEEKRVIRLHALIKEVIKLMRGSIPSTIRIVDEVDRDSEPVLADPTQIHQVVMNLCTNAYHAMENSGGTLTVGLRRSVLTQADMIHFPNLPQGPGVYMVIDVKDTGCGMPLEVRERIFDPYFTTKEEGRGTGLGLATVYSITKACQGGVQVKTAPGQGSVFSVYLPASGSDAEEGGPTSAVSQRKVGRGENLLIVDDDREIALMYQEGFELLGYSPKIFFSSKAALDYFETRGDEVDLAVLDQTMPEKTGIELARDFLDKRPELPVILCSGYSANVTRDKVKDVGISRFFMKPVTVDTLSEAIQELLKR